LTITAHNQARTAADPIPRVQITIPADLHTKSSQSGLRDMNTNFQWITGVIHPFEYDVASLVPPVFEAYARVFHPAYEIGMPEPQFPVSWNVVAKANNRIAHPAMEWGPGRLLEFAEGSVEDAAEPFGIPGRTANLWWASDQHWCVAADIDLMTTYVGGSAHCIQEIVTSDAIEALPATSDQRVTWDADTINPLPDPP
jgi:hypothetical protein